MGVGRFVIILLLMLLSFIGVSLSLTELSSALFMKELYLLLLLLVVAGIAIYAVTKDGRLGWLLFCIFFATFIVNALYISLEAPGHRMTLYSVMLFSALGFLFAVTPRRMPQKRRVQPQARPQVIIEDIEPLKEIEPEEIKAPVKRRRRRKKSRGKAG
jgi:hypothetical protein